MAGEQSFVLENQNLLFKEFQFFYVTEKLMEHGMHYMLLYP